MGTSKSNIRGLKIGDLVTHVLYGPEWIGVIIDFKEEPDAQHNLHRLKALVQVQPGTKYDSFFSKRTVKINKVNDNLGYVSVNWLFKIEEK